MKRLLLAAAIMLTAATTQAQVSPFQSGYTFGVRPYSAIQQQQSRILQGQQNYWQQNQQQLMFRQFQRLIRQNQSTNRTRNNFRRFRFYDTNGRYIGYAK